MEDQEAMEEQRMEVIRELADLERERDKEVNKLRRRFSKPSQGSISPCKRRDMFV